MGTKKRKLAGTVIGVVGGNALIAFAVAAFIVPQGIIMGGATGIGLLLSRIIPLPLSMLVLTVNAALFIWGTIVLGKKFAVTTIASTFLYPAFLQAIQMIPGITKLTDNIMLSALYGGVILGAGIGMIVRVGASTGGTDIFALIFNKWFHIPVFQFPVRESQHLKNTNPSGQRLRNVLHHPDLLRAGQPEHSRLLFFVDQNFDERQQLRRILNLVDQYRRLMPFQKQLGIFFCQIAVTGNIQ